MPATLRQLLAGLRACVIFTVLLGIAYPFVVWGVGRVAFPNQSQGSLVVRDGQVVGSALVGQSFAPEGGDATPWFQPRPSAGDYDALASAGSNAGPRSEDLAAAIEERRAEVAEREGVDPASVPGDALTASASGLDAEISPAYAALQVDRVAQARGLSPERVRDLVTDHTRGRTLGFLGQPRVNVVTLNLALASTG